MHCYMLQLKTSEILGFNAWEHRDWDLKSIRGKCGYRGGGERGSGPPGKSQVIWVYIGKQQLDPPGNSWTPLENVEPLWNIEK